MRNTELERIIDERVALALANAAAGHAQPEGIKPVHSHQQSLSYGVANRINGRVTGVSREDVGGLASAAIDLAKWRSESLKIPNIEYCHWDTEPRDAGADAIIIYASAAASVPGRSFIPFKEWIYSNPIPKLFTEIPESLKEYV